MVLKTFSTLSLIVICLISLAQDFGTITGKIVDETGNPIQLVNLVLEENQNYGTYSDEKGNYTLKIPSGKIFTLSISGVGFDLQKQMVVVKEKEVKSLSIILKGRIERIPETQIIEDKTEREEASTVEIKLQEGTLPNISGNLESYLAFQALGVSKTNELSSAYSVRGGNYDENLVYVNDFEIYRPFLIRSGQQEGLSFANPDMVSNIKFSSGGFQAKYGDKLSSVLDISYRKPKEFGGSVSLSLLGATGHLEGATLNKNLKFILGMRYKNSRYALNSLNTKGEYNPAFVDFQSFITYSFSDKLELEWINNYARNRYRFQPEDRVTTFGVVNAVLKLNLFFDGQEFDTYESLMSGLSLNHRVNNKLQLKWLASAYRTVEEERFDIRGDYFLGEVETDFSEEDFGDIVFGLGVGTLHDWARNDLQSSIYSGGHRGTYFTEKHLVKWGVDYKHEIIQDQISEWERADSAGYSLPFSTEEVLISDILRSDFDLESNRISGFLQDSWLIGDSTNMSITYGARFQYWDVNKEFLVSPRVQLSFKPFVKDVVFKFAGGAYMQPPFYREMRNLDGEVNLNLKAQKSIHVVAGFDYNFLAWDRKFKFVTELYYKYMWDLVPYELDNVLIRYFGDNEATGYAAGLDLRLHGEFIEGAESWIGVSIMQTEENLDNDSYDRYLLKDGTEIPQALIQFAESVDTVTVFPGRIPRPTDQRVSFSIFFQDYIPNNDNFKVHLNLLFGTGLPFGPPDNDRFRDQLRIPSYRRLDIGFSAQLYSKERRIEKKGESSSFLNSIWATAEVYNLLGISNTVSYLWIKDFRNTSYAVPNFLTSRRLNVRVIAKF